MLQLILYEDLLSENENLKEELSFKDQLIESLQEEIKALWERVENLKESAEEWKARFHDFAQEAGKRIMSHFGYELEDENITEYPTKEFADACAGIRENVADIDPQLLRTIPDHEEGGTFRVVLRNDEGYETLCGGFESRLEAEAWQKNYATSVTNLENIVREERGLRR